MAEAGTAGDGRDGAGEDWGRPRPWPEPLDPRAYHGIAGEIVRALEPATEADPAGILAVLLAGCGNVLGRGIAVEMSNKRHGLLIYPVLVGVTGLGRKGTAQATAEVLLRQAMPGWLAGRRKSGLSTGEGLIYQVRDPLVRTEAVREGGRKTGKVVGEQQVIEDAGVADKRLFVVEEEFGRVLRVAGRENNTLSAVLREAWDGNPLTTLVKSPYGTEEAHVTVVGHITPSELGRLLSSTEAANGFGNRFLWVAVHKSKDVDDDDDALDAGQVSYLGGLLEGYLTDAREQLGLLRRDDEARALWRQVKPLLERRPPGLVGAVTARATVQVLRLAAIYAALDVSPRIGRAHLEAALAFWRYCEDSAMCLFGDTTGDPIMDAIIVALRERRRTTTELQNLFNRNVPQLPETLDLMEDRGMVYSEEVLTGKRGRPPVLWGLVEPDPAGGAS